ncbi:hypothetical protein [Pseudobacteriovorax antillogorgiicola]|uniref:VWFA domain-containing protein n=1 Tax=Pseudobacteriovorax antillogorgiicola TaxID=1513793 RepID=A0A1Y6CG62_9BACT|nr:hypothetical protein [Pseudobacteriovorax antillogorgiicola]TCS47646.1 hypothetical protein EDD56_12087 [Pseudobacteriovorax antillogorgiicola]SMF59860.1 hypothetical protein SAMN06296036_12053 [Pseudobacteriovorax antillogorgiicola]
MLTTSQGAVRLFQSITILSITSIFTQGCAQGPELLNKRTPAVSRDLASTAARQSYRIVKSFDSTTVGETEVEFSASYRTAKQSIVLNRKYEVVQQDFQQITRPAHRDDFTQGTLGSRAEEAFSQNDFGILDLLIIVDNSHSMQEEHEKLAVELPSLLSKVSGSDWQITITTTDPADGCFTKIIRKSDPEPEADFAKAILDTGIAGTGDESGFLQIANALNCSGEWLRDNSNLGVLIVSDEDNCSDGTLCANDESESAEVDYVTEKLAAYRTLGEDVRIYGLFWKPTDTIDQCPSAFRPAYLYQELVRQSSGTSGSICDSDYGPTFLSISEDLYGKLKYQFPLRETPLPKSVAVLVNNVEFNDGIVIDGKTVRFNEAPPRNASIKISYRYGESSMKDSFTLSSEPDLATLSVTVDGKDLESIEFQVIGTELHFKTLPGEGLAIEAQYRENIPLPSDYALSHQGELKDLKVLDDNLQPIAHSHDQVSGIIRFPSPPLDSVRYSISYQVPGDPILSYPSGFSEDHLVMDLYAFDPSDENRTWEVDYQDKAFHFQIDEFQENRKITIRYRDPSDSNKTFTLPQAPLPETVMVKANQASCDGSSFVLEGSTIKTSCPMIEGETLSVRYHYIMDHRQEFEINGVKNLEKSVWTVFVNDKPESNFKRQLNRITFDRPLPLQAKIRVEILGKI